MICNTLFSSSIPTIRVITPNSIHKQMDVIISQQSPLRSIGIISKTLHLASYNLKKIHNQKSYTQRWVNNSFKICEGYDLQDIHTLEPFHRIHLHTPFHKKWLISRFLLGFQGRFCSCTSAYLLGRKMSYVPLTMANLYYWKHLHLYLFRFYKGTSMHKEGSDPSLGFWMM